MPVGTNATVKALDPGRPPRGRRARSSCRTPTTCTCGPGTSGSRGSAGCTGSWTGIGPILTDSGGFQVVSLGDLRVVDEDGVTFRSHLDGSTPPVHAGARDRGPGGARLRHRGRLRPARLPDARRGRSSPTRRSERIAGRSARSRPTRGRTRRCSGSSRAGWSRTSGRSRRGSSPRLPFDGHLHRRPRRRRDAGAARRRARRRRPAARRRSAAALPDGPRVAGRPARGGSPRASTCSTPCCRRASPGTASCGCRAGGSTSGTPRFLDDPGAGPGRLPVPRSAGGSRGPTWPICSGRRSCSRTVSRLVTT